MMLIKANLTQKNVQIADDVLQLRLNLGLQVGELRENGLSDLCECVDDGARRCVEGS